MVGAVASQALTLTVLDHIAKNARIFTSMATSKLQRALGKALDQNFPHFYVRENHRPEWLLSSDNTRLELDFYIEEIKTAFEVQGAQHYQFTPFFHKNREDFEKRKRADQEKRDLCYGKGIRLIEIFTETDCQVAIENIKEKHCKQDKYYYQETNNPSEKLARKMELLRKAIKTQPNPQQVEKRIRKLVQQAEFHGFYIADESINKYIKDHDIKLLSCDLCDKKRKFTEKGLREHTQSIHQSR